MTQAGVDRPPADAGRTVTAARLHGAGDVRVAREPLPEPRPGEVRLRVTAVGLCGSDLHWFEDGAIGEARLDHPLVLGHEFAGRLDDGTLVAADPCIPCGACGPCRAGREHLCVATRFAGHSTTDGALRSELWWPAGLLRPVPEYVGETATALLEPLGVALHAVDLGDVTRGTSAAVIGCGPIGLLTIQVLRLAGANPILAADPLPHRLAAAVALGAREAGPLGAAGSVDRPAGWDGVDVAFDAAGTDEAVAAALDIARPGGTVVLVGIPGSDLTTIRASTARRKELTLRASRRMRAADLERAIALAADDHVDLVRLVTGRFPLEAAPEAFGALAARSGIKVVVEPGG
jgi:L-iditol 2-dehydrogenase